MNERPELGVREVGASGELWVKIYYKLQPE